MPAFFRADREGDSRSPSLRTRVSGEPRTAEVADLWHFYDEHAAQARQHENLRATVTGTLAAIAGAITALAGVGGLTAADVPAGLAVMILGILGVALSVKHFERNRFHAEVMWHVQAEIQRVRRSPEQNVATMSNLLQAAKDAHRSNFSAWKKTKEQRLGRSPWVRMRLYFLWAALSMGISAVGLLVVILSLVGVSSGE